MSRHTLIALCVGVAIGWFVSQIRQTAREAREFTNGWDAGYEAGRATRRHGPL